MTNPLHSATLNVERKYIMSIDQGHHQLPGYPFR